MIDLKSVSCDGTDQKGQNGNDNRISKRIEHRQSQVLIGGQALKVLHQIGSRNQTATDDINTFIGCSREHVIQWEHR